MNRLASSWLQSQDENVTRIVTVIVLILGVLHHDFWWWNDHTLVLGFLPVGLAYHAFYSLGCGLVWWLVVTYAWPKDIEAFARSDSGT